MSINILYVIAFIIACLISYFLGKRADRDEIIEIGEAYKAGIEAAHGISTKETKK